MYVRITSLERGTRQTKTGATQTGLKVEGTKQGYQGAPDEEWSRFLTDQFDAVHIAALEDIGVGNTAVFNMVKKGQFWNIDSVTPYGQSPPAGAATHASTNTAAPAVSSPQSAAQPVPMLPALMDEEGARGIAVGAASRAVSGALVSGDYNKLIKKTVTPDVLVQIVIDMAGVLAEFIINGNEEVESSTESLLPEVMDDPISMPQDDLLF